MLKVGEGDLENTLSGSGSLVKTGSGELPLSGGNDYCGGTTIIGATLTAGGYISAAQRLVLGCNQRSASYCGAAGVPVLAA